MQPRCQANEFYKNYNGRNDEGQSERSNTLRRPAVFSYQADCYFLGIMHLSMLSPRGGGTPGICGAFDLFCLPHPREFDLESGPQGGDVCSTRSIQFLY